MNDSIQFSTLHPDGTVTPVRTIKHASIAACRFSIMVAEHYRDDGSCRCDDAAHRAMMVREWEYADADFEGIPLRGVAPAAPSPTSPAPGDKPTGAMTGDRLAGDPDALLVNRRWSEPFANLRVCCRLFMTGSIETPDAVADFLAMRLDASGEWVVALHAAYHHDGRDVVTAGQRRTLLNGDALDFSEKLYAALHALPESSR